MLVGDSDEDRDVLTSLEYLAAQDIYLETVFSHYQITYLHSAWHGNEKSVFRQNTVFAAV